MVGHDMMVGELLDHLDKLGVADNTIVMYSTDNGPHYNTWPDAAITPFRSEKNTNWEGGFRVPAMVRWPDRIKEGQVINEIMSHEDWVPTLMAAAGRPNVVAELKAGAADWWTEDTARMAGMAAASACFKTLAKAEAPSDEVTTGETVADSDEESTEFMGLEVRPLSGPPSRKPYERTRDWRYRDTPQSTGQRELAKGSPPFSKGALCFDAPEIPPADRNLAFFPGDDGKQFDIEQQGGVGANHLACTALTVTQFGRNNELVLGTGFHELQTFGPPWNHLGKTESNGLTPLEATVKNGSVD